jgi:Methyltransferase domain
MNNPWLNIPLDDYERHMSLPAVGQAQMVADQFDGALNRWVPKCVAVIGCAGGNGLDRIEGRSIERIVAVDINPDYIEHTRARHATQFPHLETVCGDVQSELLTYGPVDLTFAALLFEYVDLTSALETIARNSRSDAILTTVVQLPHATAHAVSPSPYKSLGQLASVMKLVAPDELRKATMELGFADVDSTQIVLSSGKRFCVQNFRV